MPIDPPHILQSATLPSHHRDPFDRIIIGQALAEQMSVVTKDSFFEPYCLTSGLQVIWQVKTYKCSFKFFSNPVKSSFINPQKPNTNKNCPPI
jgi:hypothetical protein